MHSVWSKLFFCSKPTTTIDEIFLTKQMIILGQYTAINHNPDYGYGWFDFCKGKKKFSWGILWYIKQVFLE